MAVRPPEPGSAPRPSWRRRLLLGAALGLSSARELAAGQVPGAARLLLPGPEAGSLALWGQRLAGGLPRGGPPGLRLDAETLGGPDGVTAANRFAALAGPDGRTLLLLPGLACQARLVGDPRAHFDPAGWLPVAAAAAPVALLGRGPVPRGPGHPALRLALPGPDHPAAAALLALDLLGIAAVAVPGVPAAQAELALAQGAVDLAVLQGIEPMLRARAAGAEPWFFLGPAPGAPVAAMPPPLLPALQAALPPGAPRALVGAMEAAGAAVRLVGALVLPALTPAEIVSVWRAAALRLPEEARQGPAETGAQALAVQEASEWLALAGGAMEARSGYRAWLGQRLGWSPG